MTFFGKGRVSSERTLFWCLLWKNWFKWVPSSNQINNRSHLSVQISHVNTTTSIILITSHYYATFLLKIFLVNLLFENCNYSNMLSWVGGNLSYKTLNENMKIWRFLCKYLSVYRSISVHCYFRIFHIHLRNSCKLDFSALITVKVFTRLFEAPKKERWQAFCSKFDFDLVFHLRLKTVT